MSERRKDNGQSHNKVVKELTSEQAMTINSHENFGWRTFVRHPLFQDPQPIIAAPNLHGIGTL